MELYNYENLKGIQGESVTVRDTNGAEVELTVTETKKSTIDGTLWEGFSVLYQGNSRFHIPQGTYTFSHAVFGELELFLSPKSQTEYETVITRKKNAVEKGEVIAESEGSHQ